MYRANLSLVERLGSLTGTVLFPALFLVAFAFQSVEVGRPARDRPSLSMLALSAPAPAPAEATERQSKPRQEPERSAADVPAAPASLPPPPVRLAAAMSVLAAQPSDRPGATAAPAGTSGAASPSPDAAGLAAPEKGATGAEHGGEAGRTDAPDRYAATIFKRIRARQSYDERLGRRGVSGTVLIALEIDAQGRLRSMTIIAGSGDDAIDRTALAQLRSAAPFPRPPGGAPRHFRIPMTYRPQA